MGKKTRGVGWPVLVALGLALGFAGSGCNKSAAQPGAAGEPTEQGAKRPGTVGESGQEIVMFATRPHGNDHQALPRIDSTSGYVLDKALFERRSRRAFKNDALSDEQLSRLLWAGQGITSESGKRTAPSAGALYPLEVHVLTPGGVFRYEPRTHALELLVRQDRRKDLAEAALGQSWVAEAAVGIVIGAVVARTAQKYGDRAERYAFLEAGAAAENILLQAVALGLGATFVGAFDDARVAKTAVLPEGAIALGVLPVGVPQ